MNGMEGEVEDGGTGRGRVVSADGADFQRFGLEVVGEEDV